MIHCINGKYASAVWGGSWFQKRRIKWRFWNKISLGYKHSCCLHRRADISEIIFRRFCGHYTKYCYSSIPQTHVLEFIKLLLLTYWCSRTTLFSWHLTFIVLICLLSYILTSVLYINFAHFVSMFIKNAHEFQTVI